LSQKVIYGSLAIYDYIYLGVSAMPPASGSKSAAGRCVAAKLQKELPPVAFLQQRPHRLPSLRAFHLPPHVGKWQKPCIFATKPVLKQIINNIDI